MVQRRESGYTGQRMLKVEAGEKERGDARGSCIGMMEEVAEIG